MPEEQLTELLGDAHRLATLLRSDLKRIQQIGPAEVYQTSLRTIDGHLALLLILLRDMDRNPAPLYFTRPSASRVQLTENAQVPESILRLLGEEDNG